MSTSNSVNTPLGIEVDLFRAADTLRGSMEPSDYKHVVLGLIFLKHISDKFEKSDLKSLTSAGKMQQKTATGTPQRIYFGCPEIHDGRICKAKLSKNEPVRMDVLMKIAIALDCKVEDLFETVRDDANCGGDI